MASSKEYLNFILDRLSGLEEITYRPMMGEYIIYYRGKVIGGIYDDRFLLKPAVSALALDADLKREAPYQGAGEMLFPDNVENSEYLCGLAEAVYKDLPAPKKK